MAAAEEKNSPRELGHPNHGRLPQKWPARSLFDLEPAQLKRNRNGHPVALPEQAGEYFSSQGRLATGAKNAYSAAYTRSQEMAKELAGNNHSKRGGHPLMLPEDSLHQFVDRRSVFSI